MCQYNIISLQGQLHEMKTIIAASKKYGDQVVFVDDIDFKELSKYKWFVDKRRPSSPFYATRNSGAKRMIRMHREILGLTDSKIHVDHIDHNGLNNQRSNLRVATHSQNMANRKSSTRATSKYLGVCLNKIKKGGRVYNYWRADITINNKVTYLGQGKTEAEAALLYNEAAKKHHGEFANLNQL